MELDLLPRPSDGPTAPTATQDESKVVYKDVSEEPSQSEPKSEASESTPAAGESKSAAQPKRRRSVSESDPNRPSKRMKMDYNRTLLWLFSLTSHWGR